MFAARKLAYDSSWASTDPSKEERERARQLGVGRFGAGCEQAVLPAQRDRDRTERRQHEGEAVQPRRSDAGCEQRDAEDEPDDPFRAVHHPVRLEATVARQRAACGVRQVVRREADQQGEEQQTLAVEEVVDEAAGRR